METIIHIQPEKGNRPRLVTANQSNSLCEVKEGKQKFMDIGEN